MLLFCFVGLFSLKNGNNSYFIVEQGAYSRKVLLFGNSHRNNLKLASVLIHLGVQSSKSNWHHHLYYHIWFYVHAWLGHNSSVSFQIWI